MALNDIIAGSGIVVRRNSVDGAVVGLDTRAVESLIQAAINSMVLPTGPAGPAGPAGVDGPAGATGPAGPSGSGEDEWARIVAVLGL